MLIIFDLTIGKTFNNKLHFEVTGFYTILRNALIVTPFKLNGKDTILYQGTKLGVQAATNGGQAYIYGFQGNAQYQITQQLSVSTNLTYTYGRLKGGDIPLDHIPPMYGLTSIKYETNKLKAEVYARYNGWKHLSNYSTSGEDNLPQATIDGMPSWYTLNFRTGYQINKNFNLQVTMENIADKHYRYFASGFSAPGRNLIIALKANF